VAGRARLRGQDVSRECAFGRGAVDLSGLISLSAAVECGSRP
jgi:hypothetical protein